MRKIIVFTILLVIITLLLIPITSNAEDIGLGSLDAYKGSNTTGGQAAERIGRVLGIVRTIGTVVSVVMLVVIGIKFMFAGVEERADYKANLKPYLIGAFILFTGTLIPQLIYTFMQNF